MLGAGVIGLTTAAVLAESGITVRVLSDQPPGRTTSAIAGALWGPYFSPDPRVLTWSMRSLEDFEGISAVPGSGVAMVTGIEAGRHRFEPSDWIAKLPDFGLCDVSELPAGFRSGWRYRVPIIDMPVYLRYLADRLTELDVKIELLPRPTTDFTEIAGRGQTVVNCTGLGSRELVPDAELQPLWGQLVVMDNPGIEGFFSDYPESDSPTYFICHGDKVILGGSVIADRTDLTPDPSVGQEIIDRCVEIEPRLGEAKVIEHRVGLRPARPHVRLERVIHDGIPVIHNYGHGGSGVTLAWGCAREAASLL
ncbi:FAD-dependent oxidoreductase [Actinocorallia longicatena]|uniref:D-amino-acid oxidase n=1 Tax=Actinocorallia longicatena TaxID=111803 RepID=A0ABP6Q9L2_9ACTN